MKKVFDENEVKEFLINESKNMLDEIEMYNMNIEIVLVDKDNVENSKVIITSHSPYLINYLGLNNLYLGLSNEQGRAIFKRITSSGANKINSYATEIGSQAGEYLFSIISGVDEFDKELLRKCLAND